MKSAAWKKVFLFGVFGAVGCLAGWAIGEPYLYAVLSATESPKAGRAPSLISKPVAPPAEEPGTAPKRPVAPPSEQGSTTITKPVAPPSTPPPLPDDLRKPLEAAGAKSGDVKLSLGWHNTNDLDLHCID